ncbi:RAMP superfamily CRISPR-associated protein [Pseudoalteromonas sp. SS15]|uniref:RAMP superfamily CRISPR-associated protein n=1 Tax=Pseudoalteromonas sp. SS15 TaxID=3139393 RepID=UPI003BA9EC2A
MKIYFVLTTKDPIIVSQNNATTSHECLDYIPGSALLGAIAARLYKDLSEQQSWEIFHSGAVKFGPSYPIVDNNQALPTPASWHFVKGQNPIEANKLNKTVISNHAHSDFLREEGQQYKQCRAGYITGLGNSASVQKTVHTKTAIDEQSGIAKESSLFSYSAIAEEQLFLGWIESESDEYLDLIKTALSGPITIGRSRNTEFGRVTITPIDLVEPKETNQCSDKLVIWCLSDCQVLNQNGLASFTPELTQLVPGAQGTLDNTRSFIRTLNISRFNQKRQGLDSEQMLISKGSVLVYNLSTPLTDEQLSNLQHQGLGINQQQGLGWIKVNPQWAMQNSFDDRPLFNSASLPNAYTSKQTQVENPKTSLTNWLNNKIQAEQSAEDIKKKSKQLLTCIAEAYQHARKYNHIGKHLQVGPSKTQWRRIDELLKDNRADWQALLFNPPHHICNPNTDELGWGIEWQSGNSLITFSRFLKETTANERAETLLSAIHLMSRYDFSNAHELTKAIKELSLSTTQVRAQEVAE